MSFTYLGTLATDLDKVRFHIQDTSWESGPKPADANFTDEEIAGVLTTEGTWQRTVAALFEVLAGVWGRHVTFTADGVSVNQSDVARYYREQAAEWRRKYGTAAAATGGFGTSTVARADGYSDDLDNVTAADSDSGITALLELLS
jgi:hypothetical protein